MRRKAYPTINVVVSESIHIYERFGTMGAYRKAVRGISEGIKYIFNKIWNRMIYMHTSLQRSNLMKYSMALRAPKGIHLCARIGCRSWFKQVAWWIIWNQGSNIIKICGHDFSREDCVVLIQVQLQMCKLFLQHNPWRIKTLPGKQITDEFIYKINRCSGHAAVDVPQPSYKLSCVQETTEKKNIIMNEEPHLRSHPGMDPKAQAQSILTYESKNPSMHPRLQQ